MIAVELRPVQPASSERAAAELVSELQRRRGRELWTMARRLDLSEDEASDVVQEALLRLFRESGRGAEIRDPDAWAFRVVYRLAMDQHRLRRAVHSTIDRMRQAGPSSLTADPTDRLAVWSEVDRLPPRQRVVLYLRYRADLPFEQIGEALGISANGARNHASAALATLRRRFAAEAIEA